MNEKAAQGFDITSAPVAEVVNKEDGGSWMHLRHPVYSHLLYTGEDVDAYGKVADEENIGNAKPVRVKILSSESAVYKDAVARETRKAISAPKADREQIEERNIRVTATVIVDFENVIALGKPLKADKMSDKILFLKSADSYRRQVQRFSDEIENFFADAPVN